MVKFISAVVPLLILGNAQAFAPSQPRPFIAKPLFADAAEPAAPAAPAAPATPAAPAKKSSPGGALVPVNEETVEFTAGILGGALGFAVGGPLFGALLACAANYASKTEMEVGEIMQAVSKSSIEVYNYLAKLDAKYELLSKAQSSLEDSLAKIKDNGSVDPETVKKVEDALASTTSKINELNDEYDLVGTGVTALGVIGDLVEKAVKKAGELNTEYKLTDKAMAAIKNAVDKAQS